ncbi:MAG TPA: hypothetical protein VIP08_03715 [Phenylobacterium sp.]|uniref:hypothetical protein n=1 Tax=Phenylobacterium sp. TaxID=1871053 RepID=UPI002F95F655
MIIRDFAERCHRGLAKFGFVLADETAIIEGHALAVQTVGPAIATVETLARVQRLTTASSFARYDDGKLASVIAVIPLTLAAMPGLAAGVFDGIEPPIELIARPGDPLVAIYGWGMAGATWRGRGAAVAGALHIHRVLFPELPLYGRAATPGGERALLKRIGARHVPGPGGLVVAPPWSAMQAAA